MRPTFCIRKAAKSWDRYNVDWVPTLNLGHKKSVEGKNLEQASQRGKRANEIERKRKEQHESERVLAEEIKAKKLKLNEAGEQVSNMCFTEELNEVTLEQSDRIPLQKQIDSSTQTEEFDYLFTSEPPQRPFGEDEFRNDDKKINFLHWITFVWHFESCFRSNCSLHNSQVPTFDSLSRIYNDIDETKTKYAF